MKVTDIRFNFRMVLEDSSGGFEVNWLVLGLVACLSLLGMFVGATFIGYLKHQRRKYAADIAPFGVEFSILPVAK